MTRLKSILSRWLLDLERDFNTLRKNLRRILRNRRPYDVVAYMGYGHPRKFYLRGRVLEDKGVTLSSEDTTRWRNLVNTYKRFVSDEVPEARLELRYGEVSKEITTDKKGYYAAELEPKSAVPSEGPWQQVEITLVEPNRGEEPMHCQGRVLVPPKSARFGVISDIDDTVVQTDATKWFRVAGAVLFGNARTRLPFKGVAAFYSALHAGRTGHDDNPLFYVSSSPWNLYDLMLEFFRLEGIPEGPLVLRNWRTGSGLVPSEHRSFKTREIRSILDAFPDLPFILVGDSGQEDPEIYHDLVGDYPDRILACYIRNVSPETERLQAIDALARRVREMGSTLVLANDTLAAAQHAVQQGWIAPERLPDIRERKEHDDALFEEHRDTSPTVIDGTEGPEARAADV